MHLWDINALIQELQEGRLKERDKMRYVLAFFLLINVFFYGGQGFYSSADILLFIEALAILAITAGGIFWCYQANAKGDNKVFLERFLILSLPIMIRLLVFSFIAYGIYLVIGFIAAGDTGDAFDTFVDQHQYTVFDLLFAIVFEILFYVWLRSVIARVSKTERRKQSMFKDFKREIKILFIVMFSAAILSIGGIFLLQKFASQDLRQVCDSLEIPGYELARDQSGTRFDIVFDLNRDGKQEIVRTYLESVPTNQYGRSKPMIIKIFSGSYECPKEELHYTGRPAQDHDYRVTENEVYKAGDVFENFWGDGSNAVRVIGTQTAYGSGSLDQLHFFTFREGKYMRVDAPSISSIDGFLFVGEGGIGKKIIVARGIWNFDEEEGHFGAHQYRFEFYDWNGTAYDKKEGGITKNKYEIYGEDEDIERILILEPDILKLIAQ